MLQALSRRPVASACFYCFFHQCDDQVTNTHAGDQPPHKKRKTAEEAKAANGDAEEEEEEEEEEAAEADAEEAAEDEAEEEATEEAVEAEADASAKAAKVPEVSQAATDTPEPKAVTAGGDE